MQGQYEDEETGLYYNRYRYFDPNICAYVSQDPIRLSAGTNLYSYGVNSFVWVDPLGLKCENGTFKDKVSEIDKADLPEWVSDSFTDKKYKTVVTNEKVTLYRVFGGKADAGGAFASTNPAANRIQAKMDSALLPEWGNSRMYEAVIEVPKGQVLNVGKVAEQYTKSGAKLPGQADQILLPQGWPLSWIKEIRRVPSR